MGYKHISTIYRYREIRDVFRHLTKERRHTSKMASQFIQQNYFIQNVWKAVNLADDQPVDYDQASITYKVVMSNKYFDL